METTTQTGQTTSTGQTTQTGQTTSTGPTSSTGQAGAGGARLAHQMIFVNLPVADLQRSRDFFTAVGYEIDERMSNEVAVGVRLGDNLYAMLLVPEFFARFHDHETARPGTSETLVCLSAEDRQQVDEIVDRAAAAGATDVRTGDDQEYMYGRSYTDPDGHVWEIMWMDVAAATQAGALGE